MKIAGLVGDRKILVEELSIRLGEKPQYKGAPSFAYQIGVYSIMKDGSIEVDAVEADRELLRDMHAKGMIAGEWDEDREVLSIKLPYEGHTGRSLMNITYLVACRGELINKSTQCENAFLIDESFINVLEDKKPETLDDFLKLVDELEANNKNQGLVFEEDGICFAGFPTTMDADVAKAYLDLAALMNQMAIKQKRINFEKADPENEKYSFRVWLLRLGMNGDKYKMTRRVLLKNLEGHSAFRTVDQIEVAKEKYKAAREGM